MAVGLLEYLLLSAMLFMIGLLGVLFRRDVLVILMSIELMLNAVNIAFVSFDRFPPMGGIAQASDGQVMVLFVVAVAAAEAAVGLAIAVSIYKRWQSTSVDFFEKLKG